MKLHASTLRNKGNPMMYVVLHNSGIFNVYEGLESTPSIDGHP